MTRNDKILHENFNFGILNKKTRRGPGQSAPLQNGFVVKNDEKADCHYLSRPVSLSLPCCLWNVWNKSRHRGK